MGKKRTCIKSALEKVKQVHMKYTKKPKIGKKDKRQILYCILCSPISVLVFFFQRKYRINASCSRKPTDLLGPKG